MSDNKTKIHRFLFEVFKREKCVWLDIIFGRLIVALDEQGFAPKDIPPRGSIVELLGDEGDGCLQYSGGFINEIGYLECYSRKDLKGSPFFIRSWRVVERAKGSESLE